MRLVSRLALQRGRRWSLKRFPAAGRTRAASAIAVAVVVGSVLATGAEAHFTMQSYSFKAGTGCGDWSDPIGAIFYGNGDLYTAMNHIVYHTGFSWGGGSAQDFNDHGNCRNFDDSRANGGALGSRHHIRVWQQADWDAALGWTTSGTPHEEDDACGWLGPHAVLPGTSGPSGFDYGRAFLYNTMAPGHYTWTENWGNTAWMQQCTGMFAASNGTVRYFWIPASLH